MSSAFHPDAITIDTKGGHKRGQAYLGQWAFRRDGRFAPVWSVVHAATNTAGDYYYKRSLIQGDQDLSDVAKTRKLRELSMEHVRAFGGHQRALNDARAEVQKERTRLAAVKPYAGPEGLAQAVIDIEIARSIREMPQTAREGLVRSLVAGEHPQIVDAVLRTPSIVSGISDNMRGLIESAAIRREHPEEVLLHESLDKALETAQSALRQSTDLVVESSGLELGEVLGELGTDWRGLLKPIGGEEVMDSIARRHAEKTPA